jgi:hypothetical protein
MSLDEVILSLDLISSLRDGDTISTISYSITQRNSWKRTYEKYVYKDNRQKTISWIENVIRQTIFLINNEDSTENIDLICNKIKPTLYGMDHLYITYSDDIDLQLRLRKLQSLIESRFLHRKEYDTLYKPLYQEKKKEEKVEENKKEEMD